MNSSEIVGAWPPPPGVTPNFQNPDSIAWTVITAALISPIVAVFFVLMRSYTKRCIFNRFDWDDCKLIHPQDKFALLSRTSADAVVVALVSAVFKETFSV